MGGIGGLMDKLPGLGNIPDHLKQQVSQGKEVPRMIAIISSMTRRNGATRTCSTARAAPSPRARA